jgi:hypothetical protein
MPLVVLRGEVFRGLDVFYYPRGFPSFRLLGRLFELFEGVWHALDTLDDDLGYGRRVGLCDSPIRRRYHNRDCV